MPWFNFSFPDFAFAFLSVLFEGIPFLLLGALISGVVDVFVSSERITRMLPKNPMGAIGLSGLLGLIFPMCECGSVIIIRRFIKKGVPLSCATTYMLAAPIVSPIVAVSTWQAFSKSDPMLMTSLRLGLGYLVAVGVGLVVQGLPARRIMRESATETGNPRSSRTGLSKTVAPGSGDFSEMAGKASVPKRLLMSVQSATADFLDVAFFFVIGVAVTSVFNTAIRQDVLEPLATSPLLSIVSLMGLAALLALCSTTDAFVAWTFTLFSPQAKLAFLLFGPVFDLKLFWLYGLIFKRRFVVMMALGLFVAIALLCWRIPPELFNR